MITTDNNKIKELIRRETMKKHNNDKHINTWHGNSACLARSPFVKTRGGDLSEKTTKQSKAKAAAPMKEPCLVCSFKKGSSLITTLALAVSKMVSTRRMSAPPSSKPLTCSE